MPRLIDRYRPGPARADRRRMRLVWALAGLLAADRLRGAGAVADRRVGVLAGHGGRLAAELRGDSTDDRHPDRGHAGSGCGRRLARGRRLVRICRPSRHDRHRRISTAGGCRSAGDAQGPAPDLLVVAGYYGGWVLALAGGRRPAMRAAGLALAAVTGIAIVAGASPRAVLQRHCPGAAPLRVLFLDVDQADATLVQFPTGQSLLVDAAGSVHGRTAVGSACWRRCCGAPGCAGSTTLP